MERERDREEEEGLMEEEVGEEGEEGELGVVNVPHSKSGAVPMSSLSGVG
jgi:hypothetical protein